VFYILMRIFLDIDNRQHIVIKIVTLVTNTLFDVFFFVDFEFRSAKISNTNKIQQFQNIALRKITNSPPFVSNYTLHKDLSIKTVTEEATRFYKHTKTHSLKTYPRKYYLATPSVV